MPGILPYPLALSDMRLPPPCSPQEPTLFATSIFDNIAMGRPGASAEQVWNAARAANAHAFVDHLPEGYDTQVWAGRDGEGWTVAE